MDDQRVEIRPPLRPVNLRDSLSAIRPGSKAVDGLRRYRDQPASPQQLGRAGDAALIPVQPFASLAAHRGAL
jgi:hypothetical protein